MCLHSCQFLSWYHDNKKINLSVTYIRSYIRNESYEELFMLSRKKYVKLNTEEVFAQSNRNSKVLGNKRGTHYKMEGMFSCFLNINKFWKERLSLHIPIRKIECINMNKLNEFIYILDILLCFLYKGRGNKFFLNPLWLTNKKYHLNKIESKCFFHKYSLISRKF